MRKGMGSELCLPGAWTLVLPHVVVRPQATPDSVASGGPSMKRADDGLGDSEGSSEPGTR